MAPYDFIISRLTDWNGILQQDKELSMAEHNDDYYNAILAKDPFGRTILHYAALENDVPALERGLAQGLDINQPESRSHFTPLHFAVQEGHHEASEWLLEHGADVHAKAGDPKFPLAMRQPIHIAGQEWRESPDGRVIQLLVAHGADKGSLDGHGHTAYQQSTFNYGVPDEIKELLKP
jgi:ankyrin repeat protein